MKELKNLYASSGIDTGFLVTTTDMWRAEAKIRYKYRKHIAKYPEVLKDVFKSLSTTKIDAQRTLEAHTNYRSQKTK